MQFMLHSIICLFLTGMHPGECTIPVITQAEGISTEQLTISWLDFGNAPGTLYDLEALPAGLPPTGIPVLDSIDSTTVILSGLLPGTWYDIYLRAVCPDGTSPWSNPVQAMTFIDNNQSCGLDLPIPDNTCPEFIPYPVVVDTSDGMSLGQDIFLHSVDLIVEHPWMADLSIGLRSPSGVFVSLLSNTGVGVQNLGDPQDTTCSRVLTFTMLACDDATGLENGQTGAILPEASLYAFHDQSSPHGIWTLEICDKASDDVGSLKYVKLNFTRDTCLFPPEMAILDVRDTLATWTGLADEVCDSIYFIVWDTLLADTIVYRILCDSSEAIAISGLLPGTTYGFILQKKCGDQFSFGTCTEFFATQCNLISLASGFDSTEICPAECLAQCILGDTVWSNVSDDDMDWLAWRGETPTEFTGPSGSRFGTGTYLYLESSGDACQDSATAILRSRCLFIHASQNGCDLSFWYHMYGQSIASLQLEISTDGGSVWQELWQRQGDQGDFWQQAQISLADYDNSLAMLRFKAISGNGFLGDIAIDDIAFFGTEDGAPMTRCYYPDADADQFGNAAFPQCLCTLQTPPGYTPDSTDCDDTDPLISPDADEIPCNLIDDNCNGEIDEGINPDPVNYTIVTIQDATCSGMQDGSIEIEAVGGMPPYTYSWSSGDTMAGIQGLAPGTYQATITDMNGCIAVTEEIEIDAIFVIEYFIVSAVDPSCIGKHDGFISGIVQGGTPPYSFAWNSGHGTRDISNLSDGTYQVTVTDAEGCRFVSDPITLKASPTYTAHILQMRHVSCTGGSDGSIRIIASNGALPPISYLWSNGDTTGLTTGLAAGSYTCTLTDTIGCMFVAGPYHIEEPSLLEVQVLEAAPPGCYDGTDGLIDLSVNGGTPPYFYAWGHGPFTQDVMHLPPGEYTVTVSDLHGCDTVLSIALVAPDTLHVSLDTSIHVHCPGDSTGMIHIVADGGTAPYRYDWSYGTSDSAWVTQLPTGLYSVTLSDASGCKAIMHDIQIMATNEPLLISLDTIQNVYCHGDSSGLIVATVNGGSAPYLFNWSSGVVQNSADSSDILKQLSAGTYRVTITDANGCTGISESVQITQPPRLQFALQSILHNPCFGDSSGSLDIRVFGGTAPYTYLWTNGDTVEDISDLAVGTYRLTVTDSLGCLMETPAFEIISPDSLSIEFTTTNETGTMENGTAEIFVSGGTPPYRYLWDTLAGSQTTRLATGLASGTYTITITDDAGCEKIDSVFVDRSSGVILADSGKIRIYPNPGKDYLIIESLHHAPICMYTINGQTCTPPGIAASATSTMLDISGLEAGVYLVSVGTEYFRVLVVK